MVRQFSLIFHQLDKMMREEEKTRTWNKKIEEQATNIWSRLQNLIWEFNKCSLNLKSDLSTIVKQDISWIMQIIYHSHLKNIFYLAIENWTPDQDELGPKKQLPAPNIKTFPGEFKVQNPEFVRTVLQIKDNIHILQMFISRQELSTSERILANYIGLKLGGELEATITPKQILIHTLCKDQMYYSLSRFTNYYQLEEDHDQEQFQLLESQVTSDKPTIFILIQLCKVNTSGVFWIIE